MTSKSELIECIPNFSEARRPAVVQAIVDAITSAARVRLLDVSSDLDHNRTVVTFVGDAAAVEAAAFAGIAKAAELIDLDQHTGAHPRLGATDVVPFVPIRQATMDDCVAIVRRLGERIGRELNLPVYLYEAAATRPDRQNLENIRRGQYEGLKNEISVNPDRRPDFGPLRLGKAGATVIGARPFLVAYNVYLNTSDVGIAKKVASAVRHSSGGLRYVKALGLLVGGKAQVSMNLTDVTKTPVSQVVEMVRREAARYGAQIVSSELVGMIPQVALIDAAQWYLQLDGLQAEQILENKLATLEQPQSAVATANAFLDGLAAGTATPGGGAAAAYSGAMAAALVAMVANLTIGKKQYALVAREMEEIRNGAETLRAALTGHVTADIAAFAAVMDAYKLPRNSAAEVTTRHAAIEHALHEAALAPLQAARDATAVLNLAATVAEKGNKNAVSDAGSAANLALAAVRAAALNVRSNAAAVKDREAARRWLEEIVVLEDRASALAETVKEAVLNYITPGT
jgi:glutamate formiminotransferase/formiminotetrahydrofolate cyclodeaminase